MSTICQFFGIVIQMYWREHAPPHFHALYAEHEALIDIRTLELIGGNLPRRAMAMVREWAADHRAELMEIGRYVRTSNCRTRFRRWSNSSRAVANQGNFRVARTPAGRDFQ